MDYLLKRERRRLAKDLINQQLIDKAIDLERKRQFKFRRDYETLLYDNLEGRRRQSRSYSQCDHRRDSSSHYDCSDYYENNRRTRSGSVSQYHHRHDSRECCLITLTYCGSGDGRHGDEIMIVQRGKTVFKGCLKRGDQLTFKSKRYRDDVKMRLEFYINDLHEDRMSSCCEHGLLNRARSEFFQVERVIGSKPCQQCQAENEMCSTSISSPCSSSSSQLSSPSDSPSTLKQMKLTSRINDESKQTARTPMTNENKKIKPPVSFHSRERTDADQTSKTSTKSINQINQRRIEREKRLTLCVPQVEVEQTLSEGFTADISELHGIESAKTEHSETSHQPINEHLSTFTPILSSTDRETPSPVSPPKKIYGPPQLSAMLSVNETIDSPFEITLDQQREKLETLNINEKKCSLSESDYEENQNDGNQPNGFVQFFRSMSSNTDNNQNQLRTGQIISLSSNTARDFRVVNDAAQLLLTRLGIVRQEQAENSESSLCNTPRQTGNVEYFALIYFNSIFPDQSTIKRLRSLVNFFKVFDDIDDCMAFINSITNERIILILSNMSNNQLLSKIEDLQQIFSIYFLCEIDQEDKVSCDKTNKIKGYFTNIDDIYQRMSCDINEVTRDLIAYMNISAESTVPDIMFIYSQLLSEIILDKNETESALKELVSFARREYDGNEQELAIIEEFENDYHEDRAIWWFTRQCFLSKMLNKALRVPEPDILFKLRLFIQHLYGQISHESMSNTYYSDVTVYLGQTIRENDLRDLENSVPNRSLLFFSQFLFGSSDLSKAITIARNLPLSSDEYIPVVLHLNISENLKCANTSSLRYVVDDNNDVLLNMGIMGRLTKIEKSIDNKTASIYLTLVTREQERTLQQMLQPKRNEIQAVAPFVSLIKLMIMIGQQVRAEQLVQMIFDDETLKADPNLQGSVAASYHLLGSACHARGEFKRAVDLFHLSLKTFLRFVPVDAVQLSPTYNNIGSMYFRQDEYEKAIEYHQKALNVQLNSHNPNLNAIASYSNNIGVVYLKQGKYDEAAKIFHRALKILQQINQWNDPDLPSTYDNLGDAYLLQDKYDDALLYYTRALEIQHHIEPRNPQFLASLNNSIGNVCNKMNRFGDAIIHFKRALEYHQEYLPPTHSSYASLYNNIGSMYYRQEQYTDALPYYLKSLEIEMMCLPENHPTIAVTHFNIATTYTGLGRFDDAIASAERSVEQLLKTLPSDHSEIIENRAYIETIKRKKILKELFSANAESS